VDHCIGCRNGFVLNEDNTACITPLKHCNVSRDEYKIDHHTQEFICPRCDDQYMWSKDDKGCVLCYLLIPNC